jgi:hypothetical protein
MAPKRRMTANSRRTETTPNQETNPLPNNEETTAQIIARGIAEGIAQYEASRNRDPVVNNSETNPPNSETPTNTRRGCSYKTFLACKPTTFRGTESAIDLIHWIEKMESVLNISECLPESMVKYATCTLADKALTWWNSQVQSLGLVAAYSLSWEELKTMMMEEFCPRSEMQKIEIELWNLTMTGADITGYTTRFQELARLVPHMVIPEFKRIERYIYGLVPQIRSMVTTSKPITFMGAVTLAKTLTDEAVRMGTLHTKEVGERSELNRTETGSSRQGKRKWRDQQGQQGEKRSGNAMAYTVTTTEAKSYLGNKPKCDKCNKHHENDCWYCNNCRGWGHKTQNCRNNPPARNNTERKNQGCYECGDLGHYRNRCPKLNNNNQNDNNRVFNNEAARGRAYNIRAHDAPEDPYANIGTF